MQDMSNRKWIMGKVVCKNSLKGSLERVRTVEAQDIVHTGPHAAPRHKNRGREKKKLIFVYSAAGQWPLMWRKSLSMGEQSSDLTEELMGSGGVECAMNEGKRVWKVENVGEGVLNMLLSLTHTSFLFYKGIIQPNLHKLMSFFG